MVVRYYAEAFGQLWAGVTDPYNPYALTAKEYDPRTGLYYFGARWYDPEVGRWLTPDPIRDGRNWYSYVDNNPVHYLDLWGLLKFTNPWRTEGIVEPGDTLSGIAYQAYGDASLYQELAAVNNIPDPDRIYPGQRLHLPRPPPGQEASGWGPNARPADLDVFAMTLAAVIAVEAAGPAISQALTTAATWVAAQVQTWLAPIAPSAEKAGKLLWGTWKDYPKVVVAGREYAQVGEPLYTQHAVERMMPRGLATQGRSISPNLVDYVIRNTTPVTRVIERLQRILSAIMSRLEGDVPKEVRQAFLKTEAWVDSVRFTVNRSDQAAEVERVLRELERVIGNHEAKG